jgi:hypothetical protein
MATHQTATYQQVLTQAKDLAPADKLRLLETLAAQLRGTMVSHKRHRVREFRGIGQASWDGTDAQEFVNRERDAWDR